MEGDDVDAGAVAGVGIAPDVFPFPDDADEVLTIDLPAEGVDSVFESDPSLIAGEVESVLPPPAANVLPTPDT